MELLNFVPNWCLQKKIDNNEKRAKKYLPFIFAVNLVLTGFLFLNVNKVEKVKVERKRIYYKNTKPKTVRKDVGISKSLELFIKVFYGKGYYKSVMIRKNNIDLEVLANNLEEYDNMIHRVENIKEFKILNLSALKKIDDKYYYEISIEVF